MEHWSSHFKFYDIFQMIYSKYCAMLDFHKNSLRKCRIVLDSGAGTGNLTLQLLEEGHQVMAVDFNKAALDSLKNKCSNYPQLQFREVNLENELPFSDNYFEGIASSFVIPFVQNIRKYLSESYRVLKRGGVLSLSILLPINGIMNYIMSNLESEAKVCGLLPKYHSQWEKLWETSRKNEINILKNGLSEDEIIFILKEIGFLVEKSDNKPYGPYVSLLKCIK